MHDLAPLTALGSTAPRTDTIGPVTIAEAPDWALASVTARLEQDAAAARAQVLGVPAPGVACYASGSDLAAFWIAPDSWMVTAPYRAQPDLASHLRTQLGPCASVTDQSDAWVRFDLSAPPEAAQALLERLCNLDTARMTQGAARRSVIDHLGCFVIRAGRDAWVIHGPRSSAQSLHHTLLAAARSVF